MEFFMSMLPRGRVFADGSVEIVVPFHRGFITSIKSLPIRDRTYEPERRAWIVSAPKGAEAICMACYTCPDLEIVDDRWAALPTSGTRAELVTR
jgi:hypothetical protein